MRYTQWVDGQGSIATSGTVGSVGALTERKLKRARFFWEKLAVLS